MSEARSETRKTILFLTVKKDQTAAGVADRLQTAGHQVFYFDPGWLPSRARLLYEVGGGRPPRRILASEAGELSLDEVSAVWYRRPGTVGSRDPQVRERYFSYRETYTYLQGLLGSLDCPWLPGRPEMFLRADHKVEQLFRAERLGFDLPHTLVTNRRRDFADFFHEEEGQVVSKISETIEFQESHAPLGRFTERVVRLDLTYLDRLRSCPTILQSLVPKALEVRVTVVGERLFAGAILSQKSRHAALDWRRDDAHLRFAKHDLPPVEQQRCLALLRSFGLEYGAIDLILHPDGRYFFLELNPNGQYLWMEEATGLPITEAIADFLSIGEPRLGRRKSPAADGIPA